MCSARFPAQTSPLDVSLSVCCKPPQGLYPQGALLADYWKQKKVDEAGDHVDALLRLLFDVSQTAESRFAVPEA